MTQELKEIANADSAPVTSKYAEDDLVLQVKSCDCFRCERSLRLQGPYRITAAYANFADVVHLGLNIFCTLNTSCLSPFLGTIDEATTEAIQDRNLFKIQRIDFYEGDPLCRDSLKFRVVSEDSKKFQVHGTQFLVDLPLFRAFVHNHPSLFPLQYDNDDDAYQAVCKLNKEYLPMPSSDGFLDLRYSPRIQDSFYWLKSPTKHYCIRVERSKTMFGCPLNRVEFFSPLFKRLFHLTHYALCTMFSSSFDPDTMILVTPEIEDFSLISKVLSWDS